jgi:hypothetical protein
MKYEKQLIIGYNDMALPKAELFLPVIWQHYEAWDMDTDGDYYYLNNKDGFWSYLDIKSQKKKIEFHFTLVRPNPKYEIGWYKEFEKYLGSSEKNQFDSVCSFSIETDETDLYQEFLETVLMFLEHTKGVVLNQDKEYTAKEFETEFLKK